MTIPPRQSVVIAYHLVWTACGWWLPNDPRGSVSQRVASDILADLGELHYGRKRVQPAGWVIRDFYQRAQDLLKFELRTFSPQEVPAIADSFESCLHDSGYTCYACAIMPDHVHVLIRKHKHRAEDMIRNLQEMSRLHLQQIGLRAGHPVWGGPGWKVFLHHPDDVRRTIRYIQQNPVKAKLPLQHWGFVKEYDDWPLHKASRLRSAKPLA